MTARASAPNFHGSLPWNGLEVECSRLIGDHVPNWNQRATISSSRSPNM